jgi:hypothetical protein
MGWLGLAAFLVANLPTTVALAACFAPAVPECHAKPPVTVAASTCCKHCAKKALARSRVASAAAVRPPCPASHPGCPECPFCPVPGGCALCNLTKVPCLAPPLLFLVAEPLLAETPFETTPLYTPPFCGRLTPPPKG